MAFNKDSFSNLTSSIAGNVTQYFSGDSGRIIDKLSGGDRAGAISVLLGQEAGEAEPNDWRVRLSVAPSATYLYREEPGQPPNALLAPLKITNGVIWPYTPEVTMSYNAEYGKVHPTHSNYPIHTYKNSQVSTISITGDFTAQTPNEARYVLASMMFLRASTKMFWGNDRNAGQPPPILYLNGYGTHFFPNVPVVVTSYTANLPGDPDYVEAWIQDARVSANDANKIDKFLTRIPATVTMSITVEPVYSRVKVANEFTFEKFSNGQLIGRPINSGGDNTSGGGSTGGFI